MEEASIGDYLFQQVPYMYKDQWGTLNLKKQSSATSTTEQRFHGPCSTFCIASQLQFPRNVHPL
ncbi:uncharacterized protein FOMMEDRAFT_23151, partial [Fomitiporia mediterranea MF3/22]|uniref:uncharacterized protein n=1 Tax=Fomitiporia mediterranea (strain MF3/22) TaxID=694068 RepID=UPI000440943E